MQLLYRLFLRLYHVGIRLAALRSTKARRWIDGRRRLPEGLRRWRAGAPGKLLWMHCASLGEFEQGRPLLEAWRVARPDWQILLTFFSPSGYTVRHNYAGANHVAYLPLDGKGRASAFLDAVRPDAAVFVKYEFWYYYLTGLRARGIPTVLIAAVFRPGQPFFRWYGGLHREMLSCFAHVFVQDRQSAEALSAFEVPVTVAGDPRIDRVQDIVRVAPARPLIERFCATHPVLIAGSTWKPDLELLRDWAQDTRYAHWRLIIAPHEVGTFRSPAGDFVAPTGGPWAFGEPLAYYSQPETIDQARILVIDNVGMLSSLYCYARIVYVGGGFGAGIHNTLEPMAFGRPVLFGPRHEKFPEARYLDGFPATGKVVNAADFKRKFDYLTEDETVYAQACERSWAYLQAHAGATERILAWMRARWTS